MTNETPDTPDATTQPDPSPPKPKRPGRIYLLLFVLLIGGVLLGQWLYRGDPEADVVSWNTSYDRAVAEAEQTHKPIFVVFSSKNCGACNHMHAWVFSDKQVADFIEKDFVPLHVDVTQVTPDAMALARRYGVNAIPAMFVIAPDGTPVSQSVGLMSKDELTDWLTKADKNYDEKTNTVALGAI